MSACNVINKPSESTVILSQLYYVLTLEWSALSIGWCRPAQGFCWSPCLHYPSINHGIVSLCTLICDQSTSDCDTSLKQVELFIGQHFWALRHSLKNVRVGRWVAIELSMISGSTTFQMPRCSPSILHFKCLDVSPHFLFKVMLRQCMWLSAILVLVTPTPLQ